MGRSVEFWRSLAERLVCSSCGASTWSIRRSNYETEGYATCDECGARAIYFKRNRSQPNSVVGAVEPESLASHIESYAPGYSNDWLTAGSQEAEL